MSQPSLNTLKKIALYTGLGGITAMVIISLKAQDKVSESPYFREAFKVLRAHEGKLTLHLNLTKICTRHSFCRSKTTFGGAD